MCHALNQLQVSIKRVISPSDVRASQKVGRYVRRDACGCIVAASVKMRIVNDAGPCFACSDAGQDKVSGDTVDARDDDDAD